MEKVKMEDLRKYIEELEKEVKLKDLDFNAKNSELYYELEAEDSESPVLNVLREIFVVLDTFVDEVKHLKIELELSEQEMEP